MEGEIHLEYSPDTHVMYQNIMHIVIYYTILEYVYVLYIWCV